MIFSTTTLPKVATSLNFKVANNLPNNAPITAVKVCAVLDGKVLLVNTPKGWDIPGGHVEAGESPLEALSREVTEETGGTLTSQYLIGYITFTKMEVNEFNKNYPDLSIIPVYIGTVTGIGQGALQHESTAAEYFAPNALPGPMADWSQLSQEILEYALAQSTKLKEG